MKVYLYVYTIAYFCHKSVGCFFIPHTKKFTKINLGINKILFPLSG